MKKMNYRCVACVALMLAGCATDPSAVTTFSALAPDTSKLHTLTAAYADAPERLASLDVLKLTDRTAADTAAQVKARNDQVKQIDALNNVLVNYMKSLGALANNSLVQTSSNDTSVTDGLTALAKANSSLGLTSAMITGVGKIVEVLGDAATAGYREEQLTMIIDKSEGPFQDLVATEKQIVKEGVIKELELVRLQTSRLAQVTSALNVNKTAEASKSKAPRPDSTGVEGLDPALQRTGATDIASLYLLQRSMTSDLADIQAQIDAASAYYTALEKIAAAHTKLYEGRNNLLTKEGAKSTIAQLTPIVKEANAALQALKGI